MYIYIYTHISTYIYIHISTYIYIYISTYIYIYLRIYIYVHIYIYIYVYIYIYLRIYIYVYIYISTYIYIYVYIYIFIHTHYYYYYYIYIYVHTYNIVFICQCFFGSIISFESEHHWFQFQLTCILMDASLARFTVKPIHVWSGKFLTKASGDKCIDRYSTLFLLLSFSLSLCIQCYAWLSIQAPQDTGSWAIHRIVDFNERLRICLDSRSPVLIKALWSRVLKILVSWHRLLHAPSAALTLLTDLDPADTAVILWMEEILHQLGRWFIRF